MFWSLSRDVPLPSAPTLSKKALKKSAKSKAAPAEEASERQLVPIPDHQSASFGDLELIKSAYTSARQWAPVESLGASKSQEQLWIRARAHAVRTKGKAAFVVLRDGAATVQATLFAGSDEERAMVKFIGKVPVESVVDVFGTIVLAPASVEGCSQKDVELQIMKFFVVSAAARALPVQIADAMLPEPVSDDEAQMNVEQQEDEDSKKRERPLVGRAVRLDNRFIDLRTPVNHSIFRIQSGVSHFFRDFFIKKDFVEVHSPKIIGGSSEGGSEVFKLKYFGKNACLAQSPQLYKQMCICGDMKGVFEIGPVFRAEKSNTNRHLTEFVGLDFEMEIKEHYHEILDTLWNLFIHIFDSLNESYRKELDCIREVYPFEDLKYTKEKVVLHFVDAVKLLQENGVEDADPLTDFTTPQEKALGRIMKEKYDVDFYIVDKYPMSARPFYTMPHAKEPLFSNSYDVFLRGEEITSGAQRIHDPEFLAKRATECGIPLDGLRSYINSFRYGAPPHGGAGIGLERVVMLFCGLPNIRKTSLFPRDPKRLAP